MSPDAPDRETLEYENTIPWTHGLVAWFNEGMTLPVDEFREMMLSDPDWQAWLRKPPEPESYYFESRVCKEPDGEFIIPMPNQFFRLEDDTEVKVTLEKIDA